MSNAKSSDEIVAALRQDFVDDSNDRLVLMEQSMRDAAEGHQDPVDARNDFKRELHSLKGTGSAFGFPFITMMSHRLEDFIGRVELEEFGVNPEIQVYLDWIHRVLDRGSDPNEVEWPKIFQELPGYKFETEFGAKEAPLQVVLVSEARTVRHGVRRDLESYGFEVTVFTDSFEAFAFIVKHQPDIVVVAATIDGLSGFDLIHALVSMPTTQRIPTALLTSFDNDHLDVLALPKHVPVIRLGAGFKQELAKALSGFEYRFLDASKFEEGPEDT